MIRISVSLPRELHRQLQSQAQELAPEMGPLKVSDAVRILLRYAIEKLNEKMASPMEEKGLHRYVATTYYLLNTYIASLGGAGTQMNHQAHEKANKAMASRSSDNGNSD